MCVRIRMTFGHGGEDFSRRAWEHGLVGIWYGSWTPDDLERAYGKSRPIIPRSVKDRLNASMRKSGCSIDDNGAHAVIRFDDLPKGAWVFTYFNRALHFAQIADEHLKAGPTSFNVGAETFKRKKIRNAKSFPLAELPEPFMLLAPAGRGNVHRVPSCEGLVEILRHARNAAEVREQFRGMPWDQWIAALGPKGWESLCLGYLILKHGYLPNGLVVGKTLADFDIVGSLSNGQTVFAQCKNSRGVHRVADSEIDAFRNFVNAKCFFFAYGDTDRTIDGVEKITGEAMIEWLERDPVGQKYKARLRS